jgi:hypothetical protein
MGLRLPGRADRRQKHPNRYPERDRFESQLESDLKESVIRPALTHRQGPRVQRGAAVRHNYRYGASTFPSSEVSTLSPGVGPNNHQRYNAQFRPNMSNISQFCWGRQGIVPLQCFSGRQHPLGVAIDLYFGPDAGDSAVRADQISHANNTHEGLAIHGFFSPGAVGIEHLMGFV